MEVSTQNSLLIYLRLQKSKLESCIDLVWNHYPALQRDI